MNLEAERSVEKFTTAEESQKERKIKLKKEAKKSQNF